MTDWTLIKRSLFHYRRTNVCVLLSAAVSVALLVGALMVGDSVRNSLLMLASSRLGKVELTISSPNRFFREKLADDLSKDLTAPLAPVLILTGSITDSHNLEQVSRVQIVGRCLNWV